MKTIKILTKRLFISTLTTSDVDAMFRYRSNPNVSRYQGWQPQAREVVEEFINSNLKKEFNRAGTWYQLAIRDKETEELVGDVGLHFLDKQGKQVELGITISPDHQRRGYAVEVLGAVIDHLFTEMDKHRIIGSVDPRNIASLSMLRAVGMRQEAHFRQSLWFKGKWADDMIFALLKEEWERRR